MFLAPKPVDKKPLLRHKSEKKFADEKDEVAPNQKPDHLHQLRNNQFQKNIIIENNHRLIYY